MHQDSANQARRNKARLIVIFNLVGLALIGIASFWANDGLRNPMEVIRRTVKSPLNNPLDWGAILCSVRITLWGLGLFLIADAMATWAMINRLKTLAVCFYCLLAISSLIFLFGAFYLVHSIF